MTTIYYDFKEKAVNFVSIRKKLSGMRMPWCLPDLETALVQKIKEHERAGILAEEHRQHAVSVVEYHTRTAAALRQQLRRLEQVDAASNQ